MGQNGGDYPLSQQLIQVDVQPRFFFRAETDGFRADWSLVLQGQFVVVLGVTHTADVSLEGG